MGRETTASASPWEPASPWPALWRLGAFATGKRRISIHGWIAAVAIPISGYLITFVQTGGRAQYAFFWVPLGVILLVGTVAGLRGRAGSVATFGVAIAALWTLGLVQRSVRTDENIVAWRGLHLIGGTGQYLSAIVRTMNLPASSTPEIWPVEEFTDLMYEDAGGPVPSLASTHPIVTPNMMVEATLRRRALQIIKLPLMEFAVGRIDAETFGRVDYLVTDSMLMQEEAQREGFRQAGIGVDVLAERVVTNQSTVRLLALRHPEPNGALREAHGRLLDPVVLDQLSVEPVHARFEGGLELVGVEWVRASASPSEKAALNVFLRADLTVAERTEALVEIREGATGSKTVWSARKTLPPMRGEDPRLMAVCFDDLPPLSATASVRFGLASQAPGVPQAVLATEHDVDQHLIRIEP